MLCLSEMAPLWGFSFQRALLVTVAGELIGYGWTSLNSSVQKRGQSWHSKPQDHTTELHELFSLFWTPHPVVKMQSSVTVKGRDPQRRHASRKISVHPKTWKEGEYTLHVPPRLGWRYCIGKPIHLVHRLTGKHKLMYSAGVVQWETLDNGCRFGSILLKHHRGCIQGPAASQPTSHRLLFWDGIGFVHWVSRSLEFTARS